MFNELEHRKQDKWSHKPEKELLSCINDLANRLKEETEIEEVEEIVAHNKFMAAMYDLVAKRVENIAEGNGYIHPEEYAHTIETVIDDCRKHGKDTYTQIDTPEKVTYQGDEKYGSFRAHSIQLAHNLFGNEFGTQVAIAFQFLLGEKDQ